MNKRFKWIKDWKRPEFFPERLTSPYEDPPGKVFVGSVCDLFGSWIPSNWIQRIIDVCDIASQHEFMFLTKNPGRYHNFMFPENCCLGATVEIPDWKGMQRLMDISAIQTQAKKFLSIEPLLGSFVLNDLQQFDLLIIGAMTGPGAIKPKKEWIESIQHPNIFYKNNIKEYV